MGRGVTVVLDASAVLAVIFSEAGGDRVLPHLASADSRMSAVNLAEVAGRLVDAGFSDPEVRAALAALHGAVVAFESETALHSGVLRRKTRALGLSLGDRSCLALAGELGATAITADRAWAGLDIGVEIEVIR